MSQTQSVKYAFDFSERDSFGILMDLKNLQILVKRIFLTFLPKNPAMVFIRVSLRVTPPSTHKDSSLTLESFSIEFNSSNVWKASASMVARTMWPFLVYYKE